MAVRSSREREPQATSEGAFLKRSRRPVGPFAASLVAPIFFDQESLHPPKLLKQIAWNVVRFLRQWVECIRHTGDSPSPKPMNRLHRAFPFTTYTVFFHLGTPVRHPKPIANSQSEQWHFRVFAKSRYY
jgi:hypothetical protein